MSQTKRMSLVEAVTNTTVGYAVAMATQLAVFPAYGIHAGMYEHLSISAIFVAVSMVRSYLLRRLFNARD